MPAGEPTPPPCLIDSFFARGDSYEMPQSHGTCEPDPAPLACEA